MRLSDKTSFALRLPALILLLSAAAVLQTISLSAMHDEQIWGHLRAGTWILDHKVWPHTALFSQASDRPWLDFTWAYDVLSAFTYRAVGLRALPALLIIFRFLLAAITFALVGGLRGHFWPAVGVSVTTQYILGAMGPGPACASVVLFVIELLLLLESRRTGNLRMLYLLPILFLLWTNLDLGFVYGLALYGLFVAGSPLASTSWSGPPGTQFPISKLVPVGMACVLASVASPYGFHGYGAFFADQFNAANVFLTPYKGMTFRQPQDYILLLVTMAAFMGLGVRRSRDFFLLASLFAASVLAFHSQRESWLAVLVSVGVIGDTLGWREPETTGAPHSDAKLVAIAASVALIAIGYAFLQVPHADDQLLAKSADEYPVAASNYVREHHLPPPLFNSYRWGAFLTWYLPQYPVAIDSRRDLYSEEQESAYFKAMTVETPYQSLATITAARTLLMDKSDVLADALREISGFQVVYEDRIAVVLSQQIKE